VQCLQVCDAVNSVSECYSLHTSSQTVLRSGHAQLGVVVILVHTLVSNDAANDVITVQNRLHV